MFTKKIIKRLKEKGTEAIVVKSAKELRQAIASNKSLIVVYGRINCGNTPLVLQKGQSLVGIEAFLTSKEILQHRLFSYASGLVFEFEECRSAVSLEDTCKLSNLWLDVTQKERGKANSCGVIFFGSNQLKEKHFLLHDINILIDTSECRNSGYYAGIAISEPNTVCELSGTVTITEKKTGKHNCGIIGGRDIYDVAKVRLLKDGCLCIATSSEEGHGIAFVNLEMEQNTVLKINTSAYNTAAIWTSDVITKKNARIELYSEGYGFYSTSAMLCDDAKTTIFMGKKSKNALFYSSLKCSGKSKMKIVASGISEKLLHNTEVCLLGASSFEAEIIAKNKKVFGGVSKIRIDENASFKLQAPKVEELKVKAPKVIQAVDAEDMIKPEDAEKAVQEIRFLKRVYRSLQRQICYR